MEIESKTNDRPHRGTGDVITFSLAEFLNIFYRGRWIVLAVTLLGAAAGLLYGWIVPPLYQGSVQVRPGIVSYDATGNPLRGWALKDVVEWYESYRYWGGMKKQPDFKDFDGPPVILAEFIPVGLQWTPGGNIITLSHLARSPEQAELILQESIDVFNRLVLQEGKDRDIKLAVAGARQRIAELQASINELAGHEDFVAIRIASLRGVLKLIEAEKARLELERHRLAETRSWRERAIKLTKEKLTSTRVRHSQANELLAEIVEMGNESVPELAGPGDDENPVTSVLLSSARREQSSRVLQMMSNVERLEQSIVAAEVKSDTLAARLRLIDLALQDLDVQMNVELAQRAEFVHHSIDSLQVRLEKTIPARRQRHESQIGLEEARVEQLEALEQISGVVVTDKPVRPRKLRVLTILSGLAFFASLALVLVREYYRRNRAALTAS